MKKQKLMLFLCLGIALATILFALIIGLSDAPLPWVSVGMFGNDPEAPEGVTVPILMFHEVRQVEGGTWAISEENFRGTLELLLENGYTPVTFESLVDYADGKGSLPEKPVCITLDDGYYSVYSTVMPIVEELKVPVTVFMNGKTVRKAGKSPSKNANVVSKMNAEELEAVEASPYISVQSHSYGLHSENRTYSKEKRDNAMPLDTESKSDYKDIFHRDCADSEAFLEGVGVRENLVFSYPGGKHHKWAEEVLRERGYRVSLTTDYSRRNFVVRGEPESLYLLGRMNVNDETTTEQLLRYLERE